MKKITAFTALIAVFAINNSTNAQLSGGAHLNYTHYFGGYGNSLGLGLTGEYSKEEEKSSFRFAFTYGTPSTYTSTADVYSFGSMPSKEVSASYKLNYMQLSLDYKYYLGRNSGYEDGGFYLFAGAGLQMAKATTTLGDYDKTLYYTTLDDGAERVFQPILRGGSGFEFNVGPGFLYGEGFLNIPANNVNGVSVDINLPASAGLQLGYRFPF